MRNQTDLFGPTKDFEGLKKTDSDGVEYWTARELMLALGYAQWRNFEIVIKKAMNSCLNSGQRTENHFVYASKMVEIGSNTIREIKEVARDLKKISSTIKIDETGNS